MADVTRLDSRDRPIHAHRRISLLVISPSQLVVDPGPSGSGYTSPQPKIEVHDPIAVNRGPPSSSTLPTPVTPSTAAGHITAKFENRKVDGVKDAQDVSYVVTTPTAYKIPTEHKEPGTGRVVDFSG
ncbi:hypothetical protein FRC04_001807 [Tulasnella sp. 424]|nr:hypothetical protein FRC04_001807 [Tulasnella sp. 424]KAG8965291.1 hypothetical protein FRC05_003296 [Tulasnella sp. 425]